MIEDCADDAQCTVAAPKPYVTQMRKITSRADVADDIYRNGRSAIDRRTTHHAGYALSLKERTLIQGSIDGAKSSVCCDDRSSSVEIGSNTPLCSREPVSTSFAFVTCWRWILGDNAVNTTKPIQSNSYKCLIEHLQIDALAKTDRNATISGIDQISVSSALIPSKPVFQQIVSTFGRIIRFRLDHQFN